MAFNLLKQIFGSKTGQEIIAELDTLGGGTVGAAIKAEGQTLANEALPAVKSALVTEVTTLLDKLPAEVTSTAAYSTALTDVVNAINDFTVTL